MATAAQLIQIGSPGSPAKQARWGQCETWHTIYYTKRQFGIYRQSTLRRQTASYHQLLLIFSLSAISCMQM